MYFDKIYLIFGLISLEEVLNISANIQIFIHKFLLE